MGTSIFHLSSIFFPFCIPAFLPASLLPWALTPDPKQPVYLTHATRDTDTASVRPGTEDRTNSKGSRNPETSHFSRIENLGGSSHKGELETREKRVTPATSTPASFEFLPRLEGPNQDSARSLFSTAGTKLLAGKAESSIAAVQGETREELFCSTDGPVTTTPAPAIANVTRARHGGLLHSNSELGHHLSARGAQLQPDRMEKTGSSPALRPPSFSAHIRCQRVSRLWSLVVRRI